MDNLFGVDFPSDSVGWAVGVSGTILHTSDSGAAWNSQASGTSDQLLGVFSLDEDTAWVAGYNGTILRTNNGGSTWNGQMSGTSSHLALAYFADASTGLAVGQNGTILRSTNGGNTWNSQTSGTSEHIYSVHMESPSLAWAVGGNGTILHSTDGGVTWNPQNSGTSDQLYSVQFLNDTMGYIIGWGGTALRTTNGGGSWNSISPSTSDDLYEAEFPNDSTGWVVGENGTILYTKDSGNTWYSQSSGSSSILGYVHFRDEQMGWAVGYGGTILHTTHKGCQQSSSTLDPVFCEQYTVPSGDTSFTSEGSYVDTIMNGQGCDSILDIEVHIPSIDTNVAQSLDTLMVTDSADSYQWLDCDNGKSAISSATGPSFAPSSDGSYAVAISDSGCTDTSFCHSVQNVGLRKPSTSNEWSVRPVPTKGRFHLEREKAVKDVSVRVTDLSGRTLIQRRELDKKRLSFELDEPKGVYLIHVRSGKEERVFKLIKE